MDPKAALIELLEAIEKRHIVEACTKMEEIAEWIHRAGFVPPEISLAIAALKAEPRARSASTGPSLRYVWYVQGDEENQLLGTKIDAEIWARHLFPDMAPDARYSRVFSRPVISLDAQS